MTDGCNVEVRTAKVEFEYKVCTDHGHVAPIGGMLESGGVPPEDVISGILSTLEQVVAQFIATRPMVTEWLAQEFDGEVLNERAQFRIIRLLANGVLAQQVVARGYYTYGQSAIISIPYGDTGGGES